MKVRKSFYILPVLGVLLFASPLAAQSEPPKAVVSSCFDGHTLQLMDRRIIRLAGIEAPKINGRDKPQFYSRQAKQILEKESKGQPVALIFQGVKQKDMHGRHLAEIIRSDGKSLNEMLVEQGAAYYIPQRELLPEFQERLYLLQTDAIKERRGLWATLLALPVAAGKFVGNRETLRFFPADCPAIQDVKPRNRVNFGNLMDAFLAGYAPARVCLFWPPEKE